MAIPLTNNRLGVNIGRNTLFSGLTTPGGLYYTVKVGPTVTAERFGPMSGNVTVVVEKLSAMKFLKEIMPMPYKKNGKVYLPKASTPMCPAGMVPISAEIAGFSGDDRPIDPFNLDENVSRIRGGNPNNPNSSTAKDGEGTYQDFVEIDIRFTTSMEGDVQGTITSDNPEWFLDRTANRSVEMLSINPNKGVKTKASTTAAAKQMKAVTAPVIQVIPITEYTCTWDWAVDPDYDSIEQCIGCVNLKEDMEFLDKPARGTVLFLGANSRHSFRWRFFNNAANPSTFKVTTLEFKFAERAIVDRSSGSSAGTIYGWNHIYNPETQRWEELIREVNNDPNDLRPLYPEVDMVAKLFKATLTAQETTAANEVAEEGE